MDPSIDETRIKIEETAFKRLIGTWKTEGIISTEKGDIELKGTDSYELILDGNYILHKAHVMMGNEKSETFEIIEFDHSPDKAKMHYFNSKGESGLMTGSIKGTDFSVEGQGLKFRGTITDDNAEIKGKWYQQAEDKEWHEFIELKLTKQK